MKRERFGRAALVLRGIRLLADDRQIIFAATPTVRARSNPQIFLMDSVDGGRVRCLTHGKSYNEHASFSPTRGISMDSSQDNRNNGTDWRLMDADVPTNAD